MRMRSARLAMLGAAALAVRFRAGACRAGPGFFLGAVRRLRPRRARSPILDAVRQRGRLDPVQRARDAAALCGGGQAYCVRTCDGRYFPVTASDNASRAASCNSFCPASETKVVYGSNIDNAATETENPIPNCRTRSAIATRSSRAAPATARTRSGSRRSRSRTIRPAQGRHRRRRKRPAGRRPQRRQARRVAEFLAGLRSASARNTSACRWWRRE